MLQSTAPAFLPARHSALICFLRWSGLGAAGNDGDDASRAPLDAARMQLCAGTAGSLLQREGNSRVGFSLIDGIWKDSVGCPWNECSEMSSFGSFSTPITNCLKAGPGANTLPGITNSHFPGLQHCSQLSLLPLSSPGSAWIFPCPPAFPVSPTVHLSWVGSSSYIRVHQEVVLMSRREQEVHFPFQGKIMEFNLNVFFVLRCPCETIKNCSHILSWFWHLKLLAYKRNF